MAFKFLYFVPIQQQKDGIVLFWKKKGETDSVAALAALVLLLLGRF